MSVPKYEMCKAELGMNVTMLVIHMAKLGMSAAKLVFVMAKVEMNVTM
jgi:hypothetical protein